MQPRLLLFLFALLCSGLTVTSARAQPADFQGVVASEKVEKLFEPAPPNARPSLLTAKHKVVAIDELQFVGPRPTHPFVLGNFAADAKWGVANGWLTVAQGKNAALQLAWADQFELEGVMEQTGQGGWFLLLGWQNGRGYALSNVEMQKSGSPWFLTEFRGGKAIPDRTQEFDKFSWQGVQPFQLTVNDNALSLTIGKFKLFDRLPLEDYTPGQLILGTYDTRYGPKALRVRTLTIRALPAAEPAEEAEAEVD